MPESSRSHDAGRQRTPWTRALFALAIGGPALAIGGVPPEVVIASAALVLILWIRLGRRTRGWLEIPWPAWLGGLAAIVTAIQAAPLPAGLRELLAPGIVDRVSAALAESGVAAWPSISPTPADTALEAARLALLTLLFIVSAQLPWRTSAALVSAAGVTVAGIGLVQGALGITSVLGVYRPHDVDPAATPALLTTFVNPNHQADLFLLALFAAAALLVRGRPREGADERSEARILLWAGLLVVGAALILSLSRGALVALAIAAPPALAFAWLSGQPEPGTRR
ncbi:MAG: hypothetical protein H6710_11470, partial [Myxococcales bacterium]|nr:hypothetical protein [Myxococcales bacterium]